jgi:hypothetical protein
MVPTSTRRNTMLTTTQLESIAKILGWTLEEVEVSLANLNHGFMVPDVQDLWADDGDVEEDGVYSRLYAPGYLDCTDWHGPFETVEEAVAKLLNLYADDVEV